MDKDGDAYLWATMIDPLCKAGLEYDVAMRTSRQLVALVRRDRDPDRATHAPGDDLPDQPPARVRDLDGATWDHQGVGDFSLQLKGCYRMSANDRRKYAEGGEFEGVRVWPLLLDSEGPLTEVKKA